MKLAEIFSSVQGEGLWVGVRQVFIRFPKCNIVCAYCDEDDLPFTDWTTEAVVQQVTTFKQHVPHHSVSFTGGEPTMYSHHIKELTPKLGLPVFLETNGTLPDRIGELMPLLSYVSLDYKPGHEATFTESLKLVRTLATYVKWIICPDSTTEELDRLIKIMSAIAPDLPVFFQPVTPCRDVHQTVSPQKLLTLVDHGLNAGLRIRVVPQTHKQVGLP